MINKKNILMCLILASSVNINVSYASDIFDNIGGSVIPNKTLNNIQPSESNFNSSQKKCSSAGHIIKCTSTGSSVITKDNSANILEDITLPQTPIFNTNPTNPINSNSSPQSNQVSGIYLGGTSKASNENTNSNLSSTNKVPFIDSNRNSNN